MKHKLVYLVLIICILFSFCKDIPNKNEDYKISNYKLVCNNITMENHTGVINKSTFTYGEKITLFYNDITGFVTQDSLVNPDMDIFVINKLGDTILDQQNLFKDIPKKYTEKDLNLRSSLTFAVPMMPENSYTMHVHISDKESDAYYNVKKDFEIIESTILKTKTNGLSYETLYLYSNIREIAIVDDKISRNELVYILLDGLEGYEIDKNGKADIEGIINLTDADGRIINSKKNLFPDPVIAKDLKKQVYASFSISEEKVTNPVTCFFKLVDRKSGHTFQTSMKLNVEK